MDPRLIQSLSSIAVIVFLVGFILEGVGGYREFLSSGMSKRDQNKKIFTAGFIMTLGSFVVSILLNFFGRR